MVHPICDLLKLSNESLKSLINVDTIVGAPVKLENNITVIPISRIKCSFVAGGTEFEKNKNVEQLPFGGATGGNVNIIPIAFLIVSAEDVKILHLESNTHLIERVVDEVPVFIEKLSSLFSKKVNVEEKELEKKIQI